MNTLTQTSPGIYQLKTFDPEVLAAFSGPLYPNSRRQDFLKNLGIEPSGFYSVKQVHGKKVLRLDPSGVRTSTQEADALVTRLPGAALGVLTADCVPLFFWDPRVKAVGIAHAGWRGLRDGIISETVLKLKETYGSEPKNLKVLVGPCIRYCCYEVGREFKNYFPNTCSTCCGSEKLHMDMVEETRQQLIRLGGMEEHIGDTKICTYCHEGQFFSYRRDKTQERILSVIQIRPASGA